MNSSSRGPDPSEIARGLLRGSLAAAQAKLDGLPKKSLNLRFYRALLTELCKARAFDSCQWVVDHMKRNDVKLSAVILNSIIAASAQAGNVEVATHWFHEMERNGVTPNKITYNTMIKACVQARQVEAVERWMRQMAESNTGPCVISYGLIIDAFAKSGDVNRAEYWFRQMEQANVQPDIIIFNSLINSSARCGNPEKAKQWLARMKRAGIRPDQRSYNCMLHACAKVGMIQEAEHWVAEMEAAGCPPDEVTYGSLLNACAKGGDVDRSEYWIEKMSEVGLQPNSVCLTTLVHACAKKGDRERAEKWFKRVDEAARGDGGANRIAYNCVVCACVKAGELDAAQEWLGKMVEAGILPDEVTQNSLLRAAGELRSPGFGRLAAARWTYSTLATVSLEHNDSEGARRWLAEAAKTGLEPKRIIGMAKLKQRDRSSNEPPSDKGGHGGKGHAAQGNWDNTARASWAYGAEPVGIPMPFGTQAPHMAGHQPPGFVGERRSPQGAASSASGAYPPGYFAERHAWQATTPSSTSLGTIPGISADGAYTPMMAPNPFLGTEAERAASLRELLASSATPYEDIAAPAAPELPEQRGDGCSLYNPSEAEQSLAASDAAFAHTEPWATRYSF